jgi:hypothetical protein
MLCDILQYNSYLHVPHISSSHPHMAGLFELKHGMSTLVTRTIYIVFLLFQTYGGDF